MVQQHQRDQPGHFRVVGRIGEPPGQPDRLGGEVDVTGVALVEHQVQHMHHRREIAGLVEPDIDHGTFSAADALGHRRCRDEVRPCNLAGREPAHRTQRQRHRRRRRQHRVRTPEVELQGVVGAGHVAGRRLRSDAQLSALPGRLRPGETLAIRGLITPEVLGVAWVDGQRSPDTERPKHAAATIAAMPGCAVLISAGLFPPTTKSATAYQFVDDGNFLGQRVFVYATAEDASSAMDVIEWVPSQRAGSICLTVSVSPRWLELAGHRPLRRGMNQRSRPTTTGRSSSVNASQSSVPASPMGCIS